MFSWLYLVPGQVLLIIDPPSLKTTDPLYFCMTDYSSKNTLTKLQATRTIIYTVFKPIFYK